MTWALVAMGLAIAAAIFVRSRKRGLPLHEPASPRQKAICSAFLVAMLSAWAIYLTGSKLFGGYEKQVALVIQLLAIIYVERLAATLERP